jgi:cell wall-associated NlpC family hydrolase
MSHPATPRDPRKALGAVRCVALIGGALLSASLVWAAPAASDASEDAVNRFLLDKGLIASASSTPPADNRFVSQVRDAASDMVLTAMNFLGVPYRRGGNDSDAGFDCSGFTRHVFEMSLGRVLPRRADEQAQAPGMTSVQRNELKPGDLVFFNTMRRAFSHVGIYIGEGKFIHAPRTGAVVRVEDMRVAYWTKRFNGARRANTAGGEAQAAPAAATTQGAASPSNQTLLVQ